MTIPDDGVLWSYLVTWVVPCLSAAGSVTLGCHLVRRVLGRCVG